MKISTKTIVTVGMFTAVLSVLSILTIPMPTGVPVTLQTFAMALCGYVLGWKKGTSSTLIYILLGTVGVPVFAGMTGGPSWRRIYLGIHFPDNALRRGHGTEADLAPRAVRTCRSCCVSSARCHPVRHRGGHTVSGCFCGGICSLHCEGRDLRCGRVSGGNSDPQGACSRKYSGREDKSGSLGVYSYYGRQIQRTSHRLYFAL